MERIKGSVGPFYQFRSRLLSVALLIFALLSVSASSASDIERLPDDFVSVSGIKLHYVQSGEGRTVVLLHGNEGTLQDFTCSIFDQLATKYKTIAFDRPGHGKSQVPAKVKPVPEVQALLIHSALRKLKYDRPILVAHSWSGSVALSYALLFPNDVSAIVLLGAMAYDSGDAPKLTYYSAQLPIIGSLVARCYKLTGYNQTRRQLEEAFMPSQPSKVYEGKFLSSMFRVSELKAAALDEITVNRCFKRISPYYNKIKVPIIIVAGDHDRTVSPQKNSYALHQAIPQSLLFVIPNAGHELQFTHSLEVSQAIDLAALKSAAPPAELSSVSNTSPSSMTWEKWLPRKNEQTDLKP